MAGEKESADKKLVVELQKEILTLQGQIKDLEEEVKEAIAGSVEEAQKELEIQKARGAELIKNLELEKQVLIEKKNAGTASQEELNKIEELNSILEEQRKLTRDIIKVEQNKLNLLKKEEEHQQKIRTNILGIVKAEDQRRIKLTEIWKETQKLSRDEIYSTLKAKVLEAGFTVLTLAENFNSVSAALNKATNTSGKFDSILAQAASSNVRFGVSLEDAGKSITDLYSDFSNFSSMTEEAQGDLANFTAKMDKAGISSQTTAKFLNLATRSMGMGVNQVKAYEKELFAFSRANGISMKTINDGLSSTMPRLAAFGRDAPRIFKDLAFQAKQMGIEMDKVLDITEGFTTFEGAAEAAGELNSMLGGNVVDSLELLRASSEDPTKAMEMLRNAMRSTGKSFTELSGQQQRAFASIMKTDVSTLSKMMSENSEQAKQAAMSEEQFNDAVASFIPIGDKLKNLFVAIAPALQYFAQGLGFAVDLFVQFISLPGVKHLLMLAAGVAGLAAGLVSLVGFVGTLVGSIGMLFKLLKSSKEVFTIAKDAISNAGETIKNVFTSTIEAIKNSTNSVGEIITKIASSVSSGFEKILTGIGNALVAFGKSIERLGNPAMLKGIAIAGLIVIILIGAAYAVKLLMEALVPLIKTMVEMGTAVLTAGIGFVLFAAGIAMMTSSLVLLGTVGWFGIAALYALLPAIKDFASIFTTIGSGLKESSDAITKLMNFDSSKLEPLVLALKTMADHMERMSKAASSVTSALTNPLMMPIMAAAMITEPPTKLTTDVTTLTSTTKSATAENGNTAEKREKNKETTISANLTIEVPITMNGKQIDRQVYQKIVQFHQNPRVTEDSRVESNNSVGNKIVPIPESA